MAATQSLGENVKVSVDDEKGTIAIVIDAKATGRMSRDKVNKDGTVTKGKNKVIASTLGNQSIAAQGKVFKLGLNCFTAP